MILNDIVVSCYRSSLLSGLYCSSRLKSMFWSVYSLALSFFSLILFIYNNIFLSFFFFSSFSSFLLYQYKNDIGRIRTYAPDGNCLAGSRLNHSATMSYNITQIVSLWRIPNVVLITIKFPTKLCVVQKIIKINIGIKYLIICWIVHVLNKIRAVKQCKSSIIISTIR